MEAIGNKIKTYKPDTLNSTLLKCLAILFIIIGIACLILPVFLEMGIERKTFMYAVAGIGSGIYLFFLGNKLKPEFSFDLYEKGVVAHNKKQTTSLLFSEIEDTACFRFGKGAGFIHFGFRKTEHDDWYLIPPQIMQSVGLIEEFRNRHLSYRFPAVKQWVNSGGQAIFHSISNKDTFASRMMKMTADEMLEEYTEKIIVNQHKLEIKGQIIERNNIQSAALTPNGDIFLYGRQNEQITSIPFFQITSPDIFIELLNKK